MDFLSPEAAQMGVNLDDCVAVRQRIADSSCSQHATDKECRRPGLEETAPVGEAALVLACPVLLMLRWRHHAITSADHPRQRTSAPCSPQGAESRHFVRRICAQGRRKGYWRRSKAPSRLGYI